MIKEERTYDRECIRHDKKRALLIYEGGFELQEAVSVVQQSREI